MKLYSRTITLMMLLAGNQLMAAGDLSEIANYREYSPHFSSSGQPTAEQLKIVSAAGFERVIYLAFSDNGTAIEIEDRVVK